MATIRQRLANLLLGEEKNKLDRVFNLMFRAYEEGQYQLPPERLVEQLQEVDSSYLVDLLGQSGYEVLSGPSMTDTTRERQIAIKRARQAFRYDPLTDFAISCWTNFGFGETIEIIPRDENEEAQVIWDEFWQASRNRRVLGQRHLHELSNTLLIDGEFYFVFFVSMDDGTTTVRMINTDEITKIIYHPDDNTKPLFYERKYIENSRETTMYYPDWLAGADEVDGKIIFGTVDSVLVDRNGKEIDLLPQNAVRADTIGVEARTFVCVMQVAHNLKSGDRGWPITTSSISWSAEHKRFRENRAAVASSVAMFVNKLKAKSGSRGVQSLLQQIQSGLVTGSTETNPPPVAGSTWIGNDSVDLTRLPLASGASDAKSDGEGLLLMAGLGLHMYPHWLGAGDAYRLSTATSMEGPLMRNFGRYQIFWSSVWNDVVMLVLGMYELFMGERFDVLDADVSSDQLVENDLVELSSSIGNFYKDVIIPMTSHGILDDYILSQVTGYVTRIMLQGLGIANTGEILEGLFDEPDGEPDDGTMDDEPDDEPDEEEDVFYSESHQPHEVLRTCPMCSGERALAYPDHKGLLVCASCFKTYDPEVE